VNFIRDTLRLGPDGRIMFWEPPPQVRRPGRPARLGPPKPRRSSPRLPRGGPAPDPPADERVWQARQRRPLQANEPQRVRLPDAVTVPDVPAECPRCRGRAFAHRPPELSCRTCGWATVLLRPVPG
jgi:hypothetical protein